MIQEATELSATLRSLVHLCRDAESSLLHAKDRLRSGFLGTLYQHFAQQAARKRVELVAELRRQPSEPGVDGISDDEFLAQPARWLQAARDDGDDLGIAICCREKSAGLVGGYQAALEYPLPGTTAALFGKHLSQSRVMHDVLAMLAQED